MRLRLRITTTILLLLTLVVNGTALAVPDVIRLHIIANSDRPEDQQVKLQVRDRLIAELGPVFEKMAQDDVTRWIMHNQDYIEEIAAQTLAEEGFSYPVQVKFGVVNYPTRAYGSMAYPAGKYRSLRIELGSGAGRNWWCIMFPPLCLARETVDIEEDNPDQVKVKFWLLEKIAAWLKSLGGEESD